MAWEDTPAPRFKMLTIQDVIDNDGWVEQSQPTGRSTAPAILKNSGANDPDDMKGT